MIARKSCVFYRDSRCLPKDRICDLSCDRMNLYDMDDNENLDEEKKETWGRKEALVWFERPRIVTEEEEEDT